MKIKRIEHVAIAVKDMHGSMAILENIFGLKMEYQEQIGQTGSRISPDVYIPCGISGAIQHWAGCASSKTILAINTDENAPMVTKASYAVIGDMHEVVPAINTEIRRRRG